MLKCQWYLVSTSSLTEFVGSFISCSVVRWADMDQNFLAALILEKMFLRRETGLPADLDTNEGVKSNSHCRNGSVFQTHTDLSMFPACLIGSNLGMTKDDFEVDKTELSVEVLGLSCRDSGVGMSKTGVFFLDNDRFLGCWCGDSLFLQSWIKEFWERYSLASFFRGQCKGSMEITLPGGGASVFEIHTLL